ncbi:AIPR family protein [Streptomyces lycii]|uniref:AIPR family protein n=1 Tax=Streptomyces lycii TaxID=2654337 RepID=A0ABQ7FQ57_9ACTN|nr:AIPR family protein [Streptomyces lycii]KAF4410970.1 AIPR family protein [Streptomyces lycii]
MSAQQQGPSSLPTQVRHVRPALLKDYAGLIYEDDLKGYDRIGRENRFLSRALAASAVRLVTGCDHETAGRAVIDGEDDQGIDGVAVGENSRDVWLVQAKWSDSGKAKIDKGEALKFVDGLRLIDQRDFERFNERLTPHVAQLDAAMGDPRLRITLVVALMGARDLSDAVTEVLERACTEMNTLGPVLSYRVVTAADVHQQLRQDLAPDPVNVTATMSGWIRRGTPFEAWQGTVAVRDVAAWYAAYGDALYEDNVRNSLGLTRINSGIKETLLTEPENFWYFNNGITVLCDAIEPQWPGRRMPNEPVRLALDGVSVVNGAQTVTAIHEAMAQHPDQAENADVTVRAISLGTERPVYAKRVTETTNTQNDVSQRDFIALEPAQAEIREDFLLSLGKTYVYKRGEPDPAPEAGCSVVHAATALACAHRSPELAVRASEDTDLLWERGSSGAYPRLFGEVPTALRIWRSVEIRRGVGAALEVERRRLHGRAADIARRGDLLVTHLVFRHLGLEEELDEPDLHWQPTLDRLAELTATALSWLIHHVDAEYGRNSFLSNTFTDETRCKHLSKLVLEDMDRGGTVPVLPVDYRPPAKHKRKQRRPNAVPTLVSAGRLADGTPLVFQPKSSTETAAVRAWLDEDARRGRATWVNDRVKCLLWTYDGNAYSASGLVTKIWELAGYEKSPVAVQGPSRWTSDGVNTLWDLALQVLDDKNEQG